MVNREDLFHERKTDTYDFRELDTIRYFARTIFTGKIDLDDSKEDQV